jgi:hypothetical protein
MKVYDRDEKDNFVDENGVFVGFDNNSNCCEEFGYFFTPTMDTTFEDAIRINKSQIDLPNLRFDPSFFGELPYKKDSWTQDAGGNACFRLVGHDKPDEKFLVIYNHHNGYYSHGFTFANAKDCLQQGYL